MQFTPFLLMLVGFSVLFLGIQRTEAKRRLIVAAFMLIPGILLQRYANYRGYHTEALAAFILAIVLNFLFWALIGHYNPPASSDNIQVIGMDEELEPKVETQPRKKKRR